MCWHKRDENWKVQLGRKTHIGYRDEEEAAARAHDEAVRKGVQPLLRDGESADAWLLDNAHNLRGRQLHGLNFPTLEDFLARRKPLQYAEHDPRLRECTHIP